MFGFVNTLRAKAAASGAQTIYTNPMPVDGTAEVCAYLDSNGGTGTTPTLNVKAQASPDGGTTWYDIPSGAFTQVTTTASLQMLKISQIGAGLFRLAATIAGTTPAFTFGLWADTKGWD